MTPGADIIVGDVIVGELVTGVGRLIASAAFAAEVQHLDLALAGKRNVRGFQITVDDPFVVSRFERLRDLSGNLEGFADGNWPTGGALV